MAIGRRIHVMGNTGAGKSTLAERLAEALGAPFVELDALNWMPDWESLAETRPEQFERRIREATRGDAWVVAGSYTHFCQDVFWPRLETLVYLDLALPRLVWRVMRRSWRRWRSRELLWGTNYENFWIHFKLWNTNESLPAWAIAEQGRKRRDLQRFQRDPRWGHVQFVHLRSASEIEAFAATVEDDASQRGKRRG